MIGQSNGNEGQVTKGEQIPLIEARGKIAVSTHSRSNIANDLVLDNPDSPDSELLLSNKDQKNPE